MKTNLEKWNYYLSIINDRSREFIDSQKKDKIIPSVYYIVYPIGKIAERTIIDVEYSHYKHGGKIYLNGKKPTRKDILKIAEYSQSDIPFSTENIWFKYSEIWDEKTGRTSTSSVNFNDIINKKKLFYSYAEAEIMSKKILEEIRLDKEFKELHKKDANYNYAANGYKFLGWQNGWKYDYYDEDGKLCSETGKPPKTSKCSEENYPEYKNCIDSKHKRIEVSHNSRGSENTVSCPICKIYWKYDCSD